MDKLRRELDAIDELAKPAMARLQKITGSATMPSACRVTVDAQGRLLDIEFSNSASTQSAVTLKSSVMAAYRQASAQAQEQAAAVVAQLQNALKAQTEPPPEKTREEIALDMLEDESRRYDLRTNRWV